jgi:hypothetical protein
VSGVGGDHLYDKLSDLIAEQRKFIFPEQAEIGRGIDFIQQF